MYHLINLLGIFQNFTTDRYIYVCVCVRACTKANLFCQRTRVYVWPSKCWFFFN